MAEAMAAQCDAVDASTAYPYPRAMAHARAMGCPSLPSLWLPQGLSRGAPAATIYACRSSGATGSYQRAGLPPGGPAAPASQLELFGQCWRWTQPAPFLNHAESRRRSGAGRLGLPRAARGRGPCCPAGGQLAALPRFTCYTRLGVHPSFLTQLLNANDELLRSRASALQACASVEPLQLCGRAQRSKCGATRRRRPT